MARYVNTATSFEDDVTVQGKLSSKGALHTNDNLTVTGNADVTGNLTASKQLILSSETVAAGNGGSSPTALSLNTIISFVTTATSSSHVSLADGVVGQVKKIIHKTRANSTDLVITPANFTNTAMTCDSAGGVVELIFDGTNWVVLGNTDGIEIAIS
tara:strand:+ start:2791 stop:3261 length:471 start_codon:yes stop_codon:yes gene_type:complete